MFVLSILFTKQVDLRVCASTHFGHWRSSTVEGDMLLILFK